MKLLTGTLSGSYGFDPKRQGINTLPSVGSIPTSNASVPSGNATTTTSIESVPIGNAIVPSSDPSVPRFDLSVQDSVVIVLEHNALVWRRLSRL